jgi:lipase
MSAARPTAPRDRFLDVGGGRFHALDWGGDAPPLVLLHATGFHAHLWDPIARRLAARFHVVALDLRGHGDSPKPESGYHWDVLIDDVTAMLDALGFRDVVAAGHSLGATTIAGAAVARPDLFARLVLLDVILFPREFRGLTEDENPMARAARKRREIWDSREQMFESWTGRPPFDTWRKEVLRLYIDHGTDPLGDGTVRLKCPGRIEAQIFGMASDYDAWGSLDRLSQPTLLVRGARSDTFSERDAEEALRRLPNGQLLTMNGTTHFIPMEAPDEVAEAIERFATEDERPGASRPIRGAG